MAQVVQTINGQIDEGEGERMKVLCPICGREGTLEVRGRSSRVVHYEYLDGKRVFTKHVVGTEAGNMGTEFGTVKLNSVLSGSSNDIVRGCRLVWSRLGDLGSLDPGSNPGSPTSQTFYQSQASTYRDRN